MAKYDESFKLEMVQKYLGGQIGHKALAKQAGLGATLLSRWIHNYQTHGIKGLRKKHSHYSVQFKLNVLVQAKRQELSDRQAAVIFDLRGGGGVVARWRRLYDQGGAQALQPKPRSRPPKMPTSKPTPIAPGQTKDSQTVESLRKENEALRAEVAYLKKLEALVQASRQAAPKGRKPSSS